MTEPPISSRKERSIRMNHDCYYVLSRPLPLEPAYGRNKSPKVSDPVWVASSRRLMIPGVVRAVAGDVIEVLLKTGRKHNFNKKELYPRKHD